MAPTMSSTPIHVLLTARIGGSDPVVTVFSFQARPPPHLLIRKAGRGGPVEHLPRAPTV
jgi:hypothetical protein